MDVSIRLAKKEDMPAVLNLIKQLAIFEKEPGAVEVTLEELSRDGFSDYPAFKCFIAEQKNAILGMALVYLRYSTWKGKALHLEDLIVDAEQRGQGVGSLLLDEVIKYGHKLGVKRIGWEVLDWNEPAIAFYEQKGATILRDWDVVQLDEQGIKTYLSKL